VVNFEEKFQNAFIELDTNGRIEIMLELLKSELPLIAVDNFNYFLLYFERILSEYTLNRDLWELFLSFTDDLCKNKEQRVSIYSRATKNCPKELEFWLGYLRELEKSEAPGELISEAVLTSIAKGEEGIQFMYEILKHFCEYYARQFVNPGGVKPDLEHN
jgi:hypothetical protein